MSGFVNRGNKVDFPRNQIKLGILIVNINLYLQSNKIRKSSRFCHKLCYISNIFGVNSADYACHALKKNANSLKMSADKGMLAI